MTRKLLILYCVLYYVLNSSRAYRWLSCQPDTTKKRENNNDIADSFYRSLNYLHSTRSHYSLSSKRPRISLHDREKSNQNRRNLRNRFQMLNRKTRVLFVPFLQWTLCLPQFHVFQGHPSIVEQDIHRTSSHSIPFRELKFSTYLIPFNPSRTNSTTFASKPLKWVNDK